MSELLERELTNSEKAIMELICDGHQNAFIASVLKISLSTVKSHMKSVLIKLRARNRAQASAIYVLRKEAKGG